MDYQGNSKKSKDKDVKTESSKKPLEKIVTGEVVVKPTPISTRFKNIFFGGDIETARKYVISEVVLPAIRNLVVEVVSKGADRLMYGESAHRRRTSTYSPRIQYNNPVNRSGSPRGYLSDQRSIDKWQQGSKKSFDDIIVANKEDADTVVERLTDIVDMYEVVSVADLYELLGLPSSHVDNKWGWTQLSSIEVRQTREGYQISFPPLEEVS